MRILLIITGLLCQLSMAHALQSVVRVGSGLYQDPSWGYDIVLKSNVNRVFFRLDSIEGGACKANRSVRIFAAGADVEKDRTVDGQFGQLIPVTFSGRGWTKIHVAAWNPQENGLAKDRKTCGYKVSVYDAYAGECPLLSDEFQKDKNREKFQTGWTFYKNGDTYEDERYTDDLSLCKAPTPQHQGQQSAE
jgi:hypothetical protein